MENEDRAFSETNDMIQQWYFDYFVHTCAKLVDPNGSQDKTSNWEQIERTMSMIQCLLHESVDPEYPGNKIKAHLLELLSLTRNVAIRLESEEQESQTDLLENFREILRSLMYIYENSEAVRSEAEVCLFETNYVICHVAAKLNLTEASPKQLLSKLISEAHRNLRRFRNLEDDVQTAKLNTCNKLRSHPRSISEIEIQPLLASLLQLVKDVEHSLDAPYLIEIAALHKLRTKLKENPGEEEEELLAHDRPESRGDVENVLAEIGYAGNTLNGQRKRKGAEESLCKIRKSFKASKRATRPSDGVDRTQRKRSAPIDDESSPRSGRSSSDSSDDQLSSSDTARRRRPVVLKKIVPRQSLINFARAVKPPSHQTLRMGRWTQEEVDEFILATLTIGEGYWVEIKRAIDSKRSSTQLKDKWKSMPIDRILSVARENDLKYTGKKWHQ
ncbi:uncharacterized protein LOC101855645 [Aplysia californica]|uniref:Uncharacterized protein LOC101855645 n=1 Tax=Aplysia californica TaxID=6500 RepID=A0ABM0JQH6_APLCA|nr:uncharacterized protein LOC101855645 [Aplysia californica]